MADVSKVKVGNTSYNIKDTAGRKEANLEWGGKNFSASYGCIDAAMVPELGANRLAFISANSITIEYSRDNGDTWLDYEATDASKINLFNGNSSNFSIGKANGNYKATEHAGCQLRVTIDSSLAPVYTTFNKFVIYLTTYGSYNCTCTIQKAKKSEPTNYVDHVVNVPVAGWSGYNVINCSSITTYGNTDAQYIKLRFIFKGDVDPSGTSNYSGLYIQKIFGFGGVGWTTPSTMARNGHMYTYDYAKNVTFPAQVTATQFNGVFNGNLNQSSMIASINKLSTGSSDSNRNDYIITQYSGGGTSNSTYYRRPLYRVFAALNASDITTALTFTPYDSSNPDGFITSSDVPVKGVQKNSSDLTPDANGKVNITVPTVTDTYSGTSSDAMSGKAVKSAIDALDGTITGSAGSGKTLTAFSQTDGKVTATFGDISITKSQISDFPTIPTVNNATLTIQKNGVTVKTFTANASSNVTANITVPTKTSELNNDSGYTTNTGTVTSVKVGSTSYSPTSGVVSLPAYPSVPITGVQLNGQTLTPASGVVNVSTGIAKDEYGPTTSDRILARGNIFVPTWTTNPEQVTLHDDYFYNGLIPVRIGDVDELIRDIPSGITWSNFAYFRIMNMSVLQATVTWTSTVHATSLTLGYIRDNHTSPDSNYQYTDWPFKAVTTLAQRDNGSGANRDTARLIISDSTGAITVAVNGSAPTAYANFARVQFSISYVNRQGYGPNDGEWYNEPPD